MKANKKWIIIFLIPGLLLFSFVFAISLVVLFVTSFTDWTVSTPGHFIGLGNYIALFTDDSFLRSVTNNIIWIVLQSTVHVAIGVVFALIIARKKWYYKIARTVFMIPNIISSAALGMLFLCVFNPKFGPVNALIRALGVEGFSHNWFMHPSTAFLTVTLTWLPFAAVISILMLAEMAAVDSSIYEAAAIDGATETQINLYVTLPMMKNVIGTGTILAATSMLQKLDTIMMTTSGGPGDLTMNMPMLIYKTSLRNNNFSYGNAQGVVLIILGLIVVGLINRVYNVGEEQ